MPTAPDPVEVIARAIAADEGVIYEDEDERPWCDAQAAYYLAALEAAGLSDPALRAQLEAERAETAKLRAVIRWCSDERVVPSDFTGWEDSVSDAGCGCCSDSVTVPESIVETLREVFAPPAPAYMEDQK